MAKEEADHGDRRDGEAKGEVINHTVPLYRLTATEWAKILATGGQIFTSTDFDVFKNTHQTLTKASEDNFFKTPVLYMHLWKTSLWRR